jgi:hypothetical protein
MTDPDRQLDDELRRIPLPEHLRASLAPESLFADAALDRLLAAAPVPEGLADRVRSAARSGLARTRNGAVDLTRFSAGHDDRLPANPPAPGRFARRRTRDWTHDVGRVAAAIGLALLVTVAGIEVSRRLEGPAAPERRLAVDPQSREPALANDAWRRPTDEGIARRDELGRDGSDPEGEGILGEAPADDVASAPWPLEPEMPDDAGPGSGAAPAAGPRQVRGAAIPLVEPIGPAMMTMVASPGDTRRTVPRSAAFDVAFEMAHGESPFVNPAADPALAVDRPPLTLRTDGFDVLTLPATGRRSRSLRERVRVEEVLAAMPAPESLRAAGSDTMRLGLFAVRSGRSVGGKPTLLVEAAAFAAGQAQRRGGPLAATLILDQAAAGDPRAWPRICRGLAAVSSRLDPADRVSVVLCGPRPRVALRDADPTALAAAAMNWEALPAAASSDLDAAVEAARAAGLLDRRTVIVTHAVTLDRGRSEIRDLLASWHRDLSLTGGDSLSAGPPAGPRFVILDPAAPAPARDAGPTFGRTSPDTVAIRRELLRQVTGGDTLVARQCRLEVRFDPGRVAAYRLVGHRQSVVESLATDEPAAAELHAGDTVRAVYEVVPKDAAGIGLATATLTWMAADGTAARLEAADRDAGDRSGSLPSPHGCELVLAATLGELAAGSVHVVQPRAALAGLAAVAEGWRARGDLTPFGTALVQEVERRASGSRTTRGR